MFGTWYAITFAGLLFVLLIIAIAFGTAALLFPVLIAMAIAAMIAVLYGIGRVRGGQGPPDPKEAAAPVSGEGSDPKRPG